MFLIVESSVLGSEAFSQAGNFESMVYRDWKYDVSVPDVSGGLQRAMSLELGFGGMDR